MKADMLESIPLETLLFRRVCVAHCGRSYRDGNFELSRMLLFAGKERLDWSRPVTIPTNTFRWKFQSDISGNGCVEVRVGICVLYLFLIGFVPPSDLR